MIPNLNCNGYNGNERKENFDNVDLPLNPNTA